MPFLRKVKYCLSRFVRNVLLSLRLKELYYRRTSQNTHTGKVALCCIAKMENEYIHYFVEYYKSLNFDKIFIYDNNDVDGERFEDSIKDYIASGFVELIDYRGRKVAQLSAYEECYDRNNKFYDWIAFFDIDEFLTFADENEDIHGFLAQYKFLPYQVIHINWKIYGDNELLDNDGRNIVERFMEPVYPLDFSTRDRPWNDHVKSILRGGLSSVKWLSPHTPSSMYYRCCNAEGIAVDTNSPFMNFNFSTAYLRHYRTKTIGEWVRNKMMRGFPDQIEESWKKLLDLNAFFEYNTRTDEKIKYSKKLLENY